MAVPKRRTGKSRRDRRRANFKLGPVALSKCSKCGNVQSPHRVCPSCGFYNGRQILQVKTV